MLRCYGRWMQATVSSWLARQWSRNEFRAALALTLALSLVTILSGRPAGWEPIFPLIFAVVLFAPVVATPKRVGDLSLLLVGLIVGVAGFGSHIAAFITWSLNSPASDAVADAMLVLLGIYTISGFLFVGRAIVALFRSESSRAIWFFLATATVCIATVQAAWIIRLW